MAYNPSAVVGPASSTSGNLATFNGTGGNAISDSGQSVSSILASASSATDTKLASYVTTTALTSTLTSYVQTSRTLTVPLGMTIGGTPNTSADLSANRTIGLNFATQAEAQAGTDTSKPMHAQDTAYAIAALSTTLGTPVTMSGTLQDIPVSATNRFSVQFSDVSTNGAGNPRIQLGTAGGIVTSGYVGTLAAIAGTSAAGPLGGGGIDINGSSAANAAYGGCVVFERHTGNKWIGRGEVGDRINGRITFVTGEITLSGPLTQVRITTTNGTDTFDAGTVNILQR